VHTQFNRDGLYLYLHFDHGAKRQRGSESSTEKQSVSSEENKIKNSFLQKKSNATQRTKYTAEEEPSKEREVK
jgi:hypothetical protein